MVLAIHGLGRAFELDAGQSEGAFAKLAGSTNELCIWVLIKEKALGLWRDSSA